MTKPCQGPDPAPRRPKHSPPPRACDCHCHVIAPLDKYPLVAERRYTPPEATLEAYAQVLDTLGLERTVIVQPSVLGTDNGATLEAMAALGARARGVAVVDADVADAELERLHEAGIRGLRLNVLFGGGVGFEAMERLAARIAPMGWHLQLLVDARDLAALAPRLRALPVDIVVDHMGHMSTAHGIDHPGFQALLALVREGACWVKLSGNYRISAAGPPYADAAPFARALIEAGPGRMVWGTDWPHPALEGPMPNDGALLDAVFDFAPDDALQRAILVDNPATLYGFDD